MTETIQGRLFRWVVLFLFLFSCILTLSPAVRARSWSVDYRWSHWIGFSLWLIIFITAQRELARKFPEYDPYLLPLAALLTGWGLLTVWRLDSSYGLRQSLWMVVSGVTLILAVRYFRSLNILRQYKYVLLSLGLFLTSLTLLFGTNSGGLGPRLWLGCCGIYFQPSEPLKLFFVIYLAAYLCDLPPTTMRSYAFLFPTGLVVGLALLVLVIQRDLGTTSIFILLYSMVLFLATGRNRVLVVTVISLLLVLGVGYVFVDLLRVRVEGWIDPWTDPSGNSYQIVQSLLAVANGGMIGRGPGLGSPGLVPVAISDFIFAAISEETGLIGSIGLICAFLLFVARGLRTTLLAVDRFQRLLAAGITAYVGLQGILILGGNLRILPLTGVTLPFVSYGGSSLLTSFFTLILLLKISSENEAEPVVLPDLKPYSLFALILGAGFLITALTVGWWAIIRGPDLLTRTDNPRRSIADRFVPRGDLIDRNNNEISITTGTSGNYSRMYLYPDLSSVVGYTHPVYGQAGLEANLDDFLRGLQGNPAISIWSEHLLYGSSPPGLDVRLSLDLNLQSKADQLLGDHTGALILMQAETGEILAMASHPTFDANKLDTEGKELATKSTSLLLNRATQGRYLPGTATEPFIRAEFGQTKPTSSQLTDLYEALGFFRNPGIRAPVGIPPARESKDRVLISPLQMALAAAALSNQGIMPAAKLVLAVDTPQQGWVILPAIDEPVEVFTTNTAEDTANDYAVNQDSFWQNIGQSTQKESAITWVLTGTPPDWQGTELIEVVLLEENNKSAGEWIASELMAAALNR